MPRLPSTAQGTKRSEREVRGREQEGSKGDGSRRACRPVSESELNSESAVGVGSRSRVGPQAHSLLLLLLLALVGRQMCAGRCPQSVAALASYLSSSPPSLYPFSLSVFLLRSYALPWRNVATGHFPLNPLPLLPSLFLSLFLPLSFSLCIWQQFGVQQVARQGLMLPLLLPLPLAPLLPLRLLHTLTVFQSVCVRCIVLYIVWG